MSLTSRPLGCYVVELLAANGIDTVFGIPGVHNLGLYRGLDVHGGLRHVLVRHEQGAGFAADGYARSSGRPAAAFVISGPGVTNILTAAVQAYSDSVPMVIIASTPVQRSLGKRWGMLHEINDQQAVMAAALEHATTASTAQEVLDFLRRAFNEFAAGRRQPVYLGIPLDDLAKPTDLPVEIFAGTTKAPGAKAPSAKTTGAKTPPLSADVVDRVAAMLASARRPLIIAGGGARGAASSLRELVDRLDGYLVTTAAGKGVLPEAHPANLGCSLPYKRTQQLIAEADLLLVIGSGLSETDLYTGDRLDFHGALVRVDLRPLDDDRHPAQIFVEADAEEFVSALNRGPSRIGWRSAAGSAAVHREAIAADFDPPTRVLQHALEAIRKALPDDAIVCSDMTQIAYLGNYAFAMNTPGQWQHPSGYGTLGYALPAAIGAKVAHPQRAVLALAGDYGVQFTLQDLGTAVELGLSLPIVVWNNAALGQIRDDMTASGIAPIGVVAHNPDFVALAQAFGANGARVASAAGLRAAIDAALERQGPTLIEVSAGEFVLD